MHLFSSFSGPPPPLLQQYDHQQLHPHHQGHTTRLPSLGGHYYLSHGDVGIHYSFSVRDRFYFSADLLLSVTRTTQPAPQLYFPLLRFNSFPQSRFPVFGVSPITILRLARSPFLVPSFSGLSDSVLRILVLKGVLSLSLAQSFARPFHEMEWTTTISWKFLNKFTVDEY